MEVGEVGSREEQNCGLKAKLHHVVCILPSGMLYPLYEGTVFVLLMEAKGSTLVKCVTDEEN